MKILQIITRCISGGAQTVIANISNELISRGHEVIVVAGEGDGNLFKILDDHIRTIKLPSLRRSLSLRNDLSAIFSLYKINYRESPDIIHLHSSKVGVLGRIALPSKKIVYTVHGFDSIRLAFPFFLPIERMMQYFCSAIVGVCKYDEELMRKCRIFRNVCYVKNGIESPSIIPELEWPIPIKYKHKVLCIARLSPQKNHQLFIDIAKQMPDVAFIWIGNQADVGNMPNNVFFLGNIPNAGKYCQLADLVVLTSNYEGMPMVILEAMSYGKPVVASNVGGVSEIVINNYTGYAVENRVDIFVRSINNLLNNKELYNEISNNEVKYFKDNLTVSIMVDNYLRIYKSIFLKNSSN